MTAPAASVTRRLDGFDALRGVAALAVVLYHYLHRAPEIYPELGASVGWTNWGQYGVHLFFVISGFVIFMTLQRSTPYHFLATRFIRLYPIYWMCVLVTTAIVWTFGLPGREVSPWDAIVNLTMLQSFLRVSPIDGAYWTLAVELAFYLQVGTLFFVGLLSERRCVLVMYLWTIGIFSLIAGGELLGGPVARIANVFPGLVWLPLFISGMALYRRWAGDRRRAVLVLPMLCAIGLLVVDLTTCIAATTVLVLVALTIRAPITFPTRAMRVLVWLGGISYPLYLIHQNVGYVLLRALHRGGMNQGGSFVVAVVVILIIAALLTHLVDIPVRGWLRRVLLLQREAPRKVEPEKTGSSELKCG
jgi:peptidoglycan/LPS O-acetylase OafA/YrhL